MNSMGGGGVFACWLVFFWVGVADEGGSVGTEGFLSCRTGLLFISLKRSKNAPYGLRP